MGKTPARNKPFTFWVTGLYSYERFIAFLNNAGFEIRDEDWQYTKVGVLLTFPKRDHAWQFRNVMTGRDVEGEPVSFIRATTQKQGPDTRNPINAVPTEAAILAALRNTYPLPAPIQTAAASQPAEAQTPSAASPPPQGSGQPRPKKSDGKAEGGEEGEGEGEEEVEAKGGREGTGKSPKGTSEPLDRMDTR